MFMSVARRHAALMTTATILTPAFTTPVTTAPAARPAGFAGGAHGLPRLLLRVEGGPEQRNSDHFPWSYPKFRVFREHAEPFEAIAVLPVGGRATLPGGAPFVPPPALRATARCVRRRLEVLRAAPHWQRHCADGDQVDLDAWVRHAGGAARGTETPGDPPVFARRARGERRLAP